MAVVVLILGYGGRLRAVERWRVAVALRTLARYGGGTLVASGHNGEAQRLAKFAPGDHVVLETRARNTWENVALSMPYLEKAEQLAIASDSFHSRRAINYLYQMRPDLITRLVAPDRPWFSGWWIQVGGAVYEAQLAVRRLVRPAR